MKTIIYAWRFLVRLKSYTIINLIGLSLSLACCIILLRYINSGMPIFSLRTLGNTFTGSMNSRMTFLFVQYLLTFKYPSRIRDKRYNPC